MSTTNNQTRNGLLSLLGALFAFIALGVTSSLALPGTGAANLQTTAGVTTAVSGSTLQVTAPNKSVLTWQNFGSGTDAIALGDTINYTLPSASSSVLNVVSGSARTQIDGTISSNGNVFVLNPNGIIVGGGARIDTNSFVMGTSGDTAFASYYFQQNGKIPAQDGLATASGSASIGNSAIINVTDNITIISKNVDVAGALIQGGLNVTADGTVVLGSAGVAYVGGNATISNPTGTTTLGTTGNTLLINGTTSVSATTGTISNAGGSTFTTKSLTATGADVSIGKVNSAAVNLTSTGNASVTVGSVLNPVVSVNAAGNVSVTSPTTLVANVINNPAVSGTTSVTAAGALTLGNIHVTSPVGTTTFTGTSVSDLVNNNFVYGPVTFAATAGDVSITKTGNSFGPVSVLATGNATVNESAALNLGTINVAKLVATSKDYIFQTGIITTPTATITGTGNITLTNPANNVGALAVTGADVTLVDNAAVVLGNVTAGGNLSVTASGAITQAADTKIKSVGNTTFVGTGLTATNAGNSFGPLTIDVTAAGTAAVTEETTLNLAALRAATGTFKSLGSIITTGTNPVFADTLTFDAGADVALLANTRITAGLTVKAIGLADLSALSFATNLNSKYPSITSATVKTPTP
jgi:filamentous hemagglutinin family protein